MLWKLFTTTFVLIFLAELGDKTQLAVLAKAAASEKARWIVFSAASLALVASTLVAVLLGGFLSRFNPRIVKTVAGSLFLLFGLLILREVWRAPAAEPMAVSTRLGALSRVILSQAAEFEKAAFDDYHALAAAAHQPGLKRLLLEIADEEDQHFRQLRDARLTYEHAHLPVSGNWEMPPRDILVHDVAADAADKPIVEHAMEHELATAGFYRELAQLTMLPALRNIFLSLAAADEGHARRLEAWQKQVPLSAGESPNG